MFLCVVPVGYILFVATERLEIIVIRFWMGISSARHRMMVVQVLPGQMARCFCLGLLIRVWIQKQM